MVRRGWGGTMANLLISTLYIFCMLFLIKLRVRVYTNYERSLTPTTHQYPYFCCHRRARKRCRISCSRGLSPGLVEGDARQRFRQKLLRHKVLGIIMGVLVPLLRSPSSFM